MKLLISAYACAPDRGSEHGVGWNWTTEAHFLGHQVWALASPAHRPVISAACLADPRLAGIHWTFPEIGFWPLRPAIEPKWERTYNLLWQIAALRHARELQQQVGFDAIHHLTWGGVRAPTFLGSLGPPLIIGPIGGGETSPRSLRDGFSLRAKVTEKIRDLSNATITLNPMVRGGLTKAAVIVVRTPDTRQVLAPAMQEKSTAFIEIGLQPTQISTPRPCRTTPPRLLFAGRLLYWKGAHIAIRAFARLQRCMPDARLTIVGQGPEKARLQADAASYKLADKVDFISWVPQQELFHLYDSHDLFVFPSLHDSGGTVVLEALSRGLPVMCLDLGGPRLIVTPDCGITVPTAGRNTEQVAATMAAEMTELFATPDRISALSKGAVARAHEFIISDRVAELYDRLATLLVSSGDGASPSGRDGRTEKSLMLARAG
ncbi:MAG TPA: glycosyltransferase family 4 protein [Acetobacteraceae bacterium]